MTVKQVKSLKIGDKVICNTSFDNLPQKGWIGKVVYSFDGFLIGIEWEKKFHLGHDCEGKGKNGYCRNYAIENVLNQDAEILDKYNNQLEFNFS